VVCDFVLTLIDAAFGVEPILLEVTVKLLGKVDSLFL
jgi:hypothetical protein